jgi:hypothetical protein
MICKNERCKKEFTPNNARQLYCTRDCANRAKSYRRYKKNGYSANILNTCPRCNSLYQPKRYKQKYCSISCANSAKKIYLTIPDCLENADRKIDKNIGYVRVYAPMHREANTWGYVYEHRIIAEQVIGRELLPDEVVHHINGKRWDNNPSNLQVMNKSDHSRLHRRKQYDF